MGKGKIIGILIALVVIVAGAVYVISIVSPGDPATLTIKFSAMDTLAGEQDATTSAVDIYRLVDGNLVKQETVTMSTLLKESGLSYTSGEQLYFKLYDGTDTSVCTQYLKWTVPFATPADVYAGYFKCDLQFIDKGDTAKDILIKYHNNTAISASGTVDVTNNSFDSNYAEIDIEVRALNDDSGYKNTFNFLKGYDNDHYLIFKASGTGWDSVNLLTGTGWQVYDKASARYFVYSLDDDDLTRDKQSDGSYNPDGTFVTSLVFDLTGFESGDSVTLAYEYRWYGSFEHFKSSSAWGTDTSSTAESVTVQY
ncbi:MAG: hypothetical protein ACFFF4_09915 [Candidatus Thorarchaeota archaeon]